eukprot:3887493-Pyramimonas_sp.AAC.1
MEQQRTLARKLETLNGDCRCAPCQIDPEPEVSRSSSNRHIVIVLVLVSVVLIAALSCIGAFIWRFQKR